MAHLLVRAAVVIGLSFTAIACDNSSDAEPIAAPPPKKAAKASTPEPPLGQETGVIGKPSFPLRSPLSDPRVIADRFKLPAVPTDNYNLADFHFLEFIPPGYDPKRPMGLLVLVNYKPSDGLPSAILPQLSEANMAFVVAKELPLPAWQRAGLALDAVFNIQKQYKVDPKRIYIMGGGEPPGSGPETVTTAVAQRLGLAFPDVFTGTIAFDALAYRNTPAASGGRYWRAEMTRPDARLFELAKERPVIIAPFNELPLWQPLVDAYKKDGFKHVELRVASTEQYHYPVYTVDWLPSMIQFLDEGTKNLKLPTATAPATKPTTTPTKTSTKPSTKPSTKS